MIKRYYVHDISYFVYMLPERGAIQIVQLRHVVITRDHKLKTLSQVTQELEPELLESEKTEIDQGKDQLGVFVTNFKLTSSYLTFGRKR